MVGGFSMKRLSDSLWYAALIFPHRSVVDGLRRSRMEEEAAAGRDYAVEMLSGEPAGTRTQGPRTALTPNFSIDMSLADLL